VVVVPERSALGIFMDGIFMVSSHVVGGYHKNDPENVVNKKK